MELKCRVTEGELFFAQFKEMEGGTPLKSVQKGRNLCYTFKEEGGS